MKRVFPLFAVLLLLGFGGYYFYSSTQSDGSSSVPTAENGAKSVKGSESVSGTFLDLLALGRSYECTFSSTDEAGNLTSGKAYVTDSGDKMYGEFSMKLVAGEEYKSYVMRDSVYNYVWGTQVEQGFKSKIVDEQDSLFGDGSETSGSSTAFSDDTSVDFDCKNWSVDNSKFVPPTNVEFVDFSEQIKEATEQLQNSGVDCSLCDQVPAGEAKTQCLSSLGC